MCFCEDGKIAVGIIGEVFGDSRVAFGVDLDHYILESLSLFSRMERNHQNGLSIVSSKKVIFVQDKHIRSHGDAQKL